MQRVLFGHGNRERINEHLDPAVFQGVRQLVGEYLALNMAELIQKWLRDAIVGGLNLQSVDGTAVVHRPRISQASDNGFYSDHTQPDYGSMALPKRCPTRLFEIVYHHTCLIAMLSVCYITSVNISNPMQIGPSHSPT